MLVFDVCCRVACVVLFGVVVVDLLSCCDVCVVLPMLRGFVLFFCCLFV